MTRTERQNLVFERVRRALVKHRGCLLELFPGFGKTRICTDLIFNAVRKQPVDKEYDSLFTVLVPTDYLRDQWKDRVSNHEDVLVNTWQSMYDNKEHWTTKVLVVDEAHDLLLTKEYIKVLNVIRPWKIVFLSATVGKEHKEMLKKMNCPIADTITLEEGRAKGWSSPLLEFNLPIQMTAGDSHKVGALEAEIRSKLLYLDSSIEDPEDTSAWGNYRVIQAVLSPKVVGYKLQGGGEIRVACSLDDPYYPYHLSKLKKNPRVAKFKTGPNAGKPKSIKDYAEAEKLAKMRGVPKFTIIGYASLANKMMGDKNRIFDDYQGKIDTLNELLPHLKGKGLIFCNSSNFANKVEEEVPSTKAYHTYIKNMEELVTLKSGVTKMKSLGKKRTLERIMDMFNNGKLKAIASMKKLEVGADISDVNWSINASYTSKSGAKVQRDGRSTRLEEGKTTVIINFYCKYHRSWTKPTPELRRLKKAQTNSQVTEVQSVSEIINILRDWDLT